MASTREKRTTAGNRLSKVLNEEVEADDFYATTYGGFDEVENDDDYKYVHYYLNYLILLFNLKYYFSLLYCQKFY